jgi:hypothetical protein
MNRFEYFLYFCLGNKQHIIKAQTLLSLSPRIHPIRISFSIFPPWLQEDSLSSFQQRPQVFEYSTASLFPVLMASLLPFTITLFRLPPF